MNFVSSSACNFIKSKTRLEMFSCAFDEFFVLQLYYKQDPCIGVFLGNLRNYLACNFIKNEIAADVTYL